VDDEPSNAASEYFRRIVRWLDETLPQPSEIRSTLTDDFVGVDRRRGPAFPGMDAESYPEVMASFREINAGRPRFTLYEILAVRGERLAVGRAGVDYGNGFTTESVQVLQLDATLTLVQRSVHFDVDDLAGAIAELDRLHDETEEG
jgi:hypothetical protein